jgi:hypothetical protein
MLDIKPWITQRFADPEVPEKWLRERRPDIYKAMFSHDDEVITPAHAFQENLQHARGEFCVKVVSFLTLIRF